MHRLFVTAALLGLALLGCKSPCRQLSEKLCECAANSPLREACITRASQEESRVAPDSTQQAACQEILDGKYGTCDCHVLQGATGDELAAAKVACGLARAAPDAGQ